MPLPLSLYSKCLLDEKTNLITSTSGQGFSVPGYRPPRVYLVAVYINRDRIDHAVSLPLI